MKLFTNQLLRFLIVGCVNTLISFLSYIVLKNIISYRPAFFISYAVGLIISYILNGKWTFSSKISISGLVAYPLVYIVQLFTGWAVLETSVQILKVSELYAYIFSLFFSVPIGFFAAKYFFKKRFSVN